MNKYIIGLVMTSMLLACNDTPEVKPETNSGSGSSITVPVIAPESSSTVLDEPVTQNDYTFEITPNNYVDLTGDEADVTEILESLDDAIVLISTTNPDSNTEVETYACEVSGTFVVTENLNTGVGRAITSDCVIALGDISIDVEIVANNLSGSITYMDLVGSTNHLVFASSDNVVEYYVTYEDLGSVLIRIDFDEGSTVIYGANNSSFELKRVTENYELRPCILQDKDVYVVNSRVVDETIIGEDDYCAPVASATDGIWSSWTQEYSTLIYKVTVPDNGEYAYINGSVSTKHEETKLNIRSDYLRAYNYSNNIHRIEGSLFAGEYFIEIQNSGFKELDNAVYLELNLENAVVEFVEEVSPALLAESAWEFSGGDSIGAPGNVQFELTIEESSNATISLLGVNDGFMVLYDSEFNELNYIYSTEMNYLLDAGTYYIEVSPFNYGYAGNFAVMVDLEVPQNEVSFNFYQEIPLPEPLEILPISIGDTVSGTWFRTGGTQPNTIGNAQYRLTLTESTGVTIDLSTNDDAFLMLLDDEFNLIDSNDDYQGLDSRIERVLAPGVYYIEATTLSSGVSADFNLSVFETVEVEISKTEINVIEVNESALGYWVSSGGSIVNSTGNQVYRLDLAQTTNIVIDLTALNNDTYLMLLDSEFALIESDDGGSGLNSQISQTLLAGTYYIEAATLSSDESGEFTLSVQSLN
ncbi:PPC domain-containing protein [Marinicellulosiphila megalodicopiae]|uniref:PPC domain-containing protein n=1 Tax=Marinicellulosiphila megalodicopiae TaxID=2724896 RepID=UPI003BAEEC36